MQQSWYWRTDLNLARPCRRCFAKAVLRLGWLTLAAEAATDARCAETVPIADTTATEQRLDPYYAILIPPKLAEPVKTDARQAC